MARSNQGNEEVHIKETTAGTSSEDRNKKKTNSGPIIIAARDLGIVHLDSSENWKILDDDPSEPRFTGVVKLEKTYFFYIKTSKNFLGLLPNTNYGAYLIFQTEKNSKGLDAILESTVSMGIENDTRYVCLKPTTRTSSDAGLPIKRSDGWMELELGTFECDNATGDKEAEIIIEDKTGSKHEKKGLKIAGIEFRPIPI